MYVDRLDIILETFTVNIDDNGEFWEIISNQLTLHYFQYDDGP